MDRLEQKVNDYINNELLNFNNIKTHELIGNSQKEKYLNHLFSRRWSRKAQFQAAKDFTAERVENIQKKIYHLYFAFVLVAINIFGLQLIQNQITQKYLPLNTYLNTFYQ